MVQENLKRSKEHEEHVASILRPIYASDAVARSDKGVRVQPGSGNQALNPNDVKVIERCYVECKETSAGSISIKHAWLTLVKKRAAMGGLRSILALRFSHPFHAFCKDYYVIDEATLVHLLKCELEVERKEQ
jgi:hypothetical protein